MIQFMAITICLAAVQNSSESCLSTCQPGSNQCLHMTAPKIALPTVSFHVLTCNEQLLGVESWKPHCVGVNGSLESSSYIFRRQSKTV